MHGVCSLSLYITTYFWIWSTTSKNRGLCQPKFSIKIDSMRKHVQKNKNKQKQELKAQNIKKHASLYSSSAAYMNITLIHLCSIPLMLEELKVNYNFIIRDAASLSFHELTYLCRASDLLILTVTCSEVNNDLISLVKRYMPTAIIVHDKKTKNLARVVSKSFGDAKVVDQSMLNMVISKVQAQNTNLANSRPFMIPRAVAYENNFLILRGFMKNGLKSNKVVINGIHEGIIEEILVDDSIISGESLNFEESEALLYTENIEPVQEEDEIASYKESVEDSESFTEGSLDLIDREPDNTIINPEFDLINKYSEYRGIRNMATCTF